MSAVASVLSAAFWGLLVLSVLVFVHEGGHYLAARALHVRVTEFFLGLPCRWRLSHKSAKVGTELGVTPLLLGGYTRICGMEGANDELLAPALSCVMRRGRVSATDLASELGCDTERAYSLLAVLSDWAAVRPHYDAALGERPEQRDWPAAFETLARDANLLTEYDRGHDFSLPGSTAAGEPHETDLTDEELLAHERARTYQGVGFLRRCLMLLAGPAVNIALAFAIVTCALMVVGVDYAANVSTLGGVEGASVADDAGLMAGDSITAVNDTQVETWDELVNALSPHLESGEDFSLTYVRDGQTQTVEVDLPDGEPTETLGIYSSVATYRPALIEAARFSVAYAGEVASFAARLIMPQHTMEVLDQSSSIVGIAVMASDAASAGPSDLVLLAAAISMSLGFMNLLPIPPLDGGKILIEVVQLALRRPLTTRAQNVVSLVGMVFFVFVFLIVVRNDVLRFVIG